MRIDPQVLKELHSIAKKAAIKAGEAIESFPREDIELEYKERNSSLASQVLTQADLRSQRIILEHLEPSLEQYKLGILSEELPQDSSRYIRDFFWAIDPLDGTLAYSRNLWGYSVSIGLVSKQGEALLGLVYDPRNKRLYKSPQPQNWDQIPHSSTFYWAMDHSLKSYNAFEALESIIRTTAHSLGYRNIEVLDQPGAALKTCILAENPGIYVKFPQDKPGGGSIWDFAASSLILNQSGGMARDYYGTALDLNRRDSSYMNHRGILFCSDRRWFPLFLERLKTLHI